MNPYYQLSIKDMKTIRTHFKLNSDPCCVYAGLEKFEASYSVDRYEGQNNSYQMNICYYDGVRNYKDTYKVVVEEDGEAYWELIDAKIEIDRSK